MKRHWKIAEQGPEIGSTLHSYWHLYEHRVFGLGEDDDLDIAPACGCGKTPKIAKTNAHLIASAPELLEACKGALAHAQLLGSGRKPCLSNTEMCEILEEAITKAEGKEE